MLYTAAPAVANKNNLSAAIPMTVIYTIYIRYYTGKFLRTREDQADHEQIGEEWSKKIWRRWDLSGKKLNQQLSTDKNGVGMWPSASVHLDARRIKVQGSRTFRNCHQYIGYSLNADWHMSMYQQWLEEVCSGTDGDGDEFISTRCSWETYHRLTQPY